MLSLSNRASIYVCLAPVDFRKGIDALAALCQDELGRQPNDGSCFLFCNSRKTAVKILTYDRGGYWLAMKRFSTGKLSFWPKVPSIGRKELDLLLNPRE